MEEIMQYPWVEQIEEKWRVHWHSAAEEDSFNDFESEDAANDAINTYYNLIDSEEPNSNMTDAEADADTLASAGWGTDEDYGGTDERL